MKRSAILGIILAVCCLLGAGFLTVVTYHPCGWLDSFLSLTGCTHQLDIAGAFGGTFSNDLSMFATRDAATLNLNVWELKEGRSLHQVPGHIGAVSPDGAFFVAVSVDTLSIWRVKDWNLLNTLDISTKLIDQIAIAPDLNSLATGFIEDHSSKWELEILPSSVDVSPVKLEGHSDHISTIAYSPDGKILASGSWDRTVRLWQVEDGRLLNTLKEHNFGVEKVVFAPDGKTLASADWDGNIRIWRTYDGELLHTLVGRNRIVDDIAFSPDNSILATGGNASLVQLWDLSNGKLLRNLRHNWINRDIYALAFSPDGKILATAQRYGPVRFFYVQQVLQ